MKMLSRSIGYVCLAVCFLVCVAARGADAADQPNIVILFADDLGYGETTAQGQADDIPTPHIDSIARNGVRFTQGYVSASYCSASRAGLMTGRFQTRFGHEFNPTGAKNELPGYGLPTGEKTLADVLHDVGYTTALIGKWHLGGTAPYHPFRRGFDEFFGFTHEGHYFVPEPYRAGVTALSHGNAAGGDAGCCGVDACCDVAAATVVAVASTARRMIRPTESIRVSSGSGASHREAGGDADRREVARCGKDASAAIDRLTRRAAARARRPSPATPARPTRPRARRPPRPTQSSRS